MRITKSQIECAIEGTVNCLYDGSEWWATDATAEDWMENAWRDIADWAMPEDGMYVKSPENRFDGKAETMPRIRKALKKRLAELAEEGYVTKALAELK